MTTTTLRYAATNSVASISNASVANARIVNGARSPRAFVSINVRLSVDATQRQLDEYRKKLITYLERRSRVWVGLVQYRMVDIDSDNGYVTFMYLAQHVKSWQVLAAILLAKGEWERAADTFATEMGIVYDSPARQMVVGLGMAPES